MGHQPNEYKKPRPDEPADLHVERELLESENERLRRENDHLRSALKAANRITSPYADERPHNGAPPRR
jgi:regulator of replication initiation timing